MTTYSHANTSANELSYPFTNNSFAASCWASICKNPLYVIVFGGKYICALVIFFLYSSNINKFVLQFPLCINHHYLDNVFLQKIHERNTSVALFLFTVVWEIATKINYVKIFVELKINSHTVYIFWPSWLTS